MLQCGTPWNGVLLSNVFIKVFSLLVTSYEDTDDSSNTRYSLQTLRKAKRKLKEKRQRFECYFSFFFFIYLIKRHLKGTALFSEWGEKKPLLKQTGEQTNHQLQEQR